MREGHTVSGVDVVPASPDVWPALAAPFAAGGDPRSD
jgi:hypothetical protein